MKHVILDTDPGVDDALAFLLAFSSPELKVEAVNTVAGNVSHEKGHRNAKQLLEFLKQTDIPVCPGADSPLLRPKSNAEEFHGNTGLGDAVLPDPVMESHGFNAVDMILGKARELGKELTIIAIGPLTNIAVALMVDPSLASMIKELVIMGGAYNLTSYGHGNANAVAEFNIWYDPEAAKIVFNSGMPIVCAGLDTTTHPDNRLSTEMFLKILELETPRAKLVGDLCGSLVERFNGFSLHDPMAVAYVIDPSLFKTESYMVDVETSGEITQGMTVVERRPFRRKKGEENAKIIVEVDAERFLKLIMERVVGM